MWTILGCVLFAPALRTFRIKDAHFFSSSKSLTFRLTRPFMSASE